jgi:subtilisin family serine protease
MEGRSTRSSFRPQSQSVAWVLGLVAALTLAGAVQGVSTPEIRIAPTTLYFGAASPGAVASPVRGELAPSFRPVIAPELRAKAANEGGVRVLVRLATSFAPEGSLDGTRAAGQRIAIRRTQDAALAKLAGTKSQVHARYEHIPFLALEVDAAALDLLASLPEVVGVAEDVFERPFLASSTAVIGAGTAWASGLTGTGQTIAILDSGVDKTHPFFSAGAHNKVVSEACYSSVLPGSSVTSLCPGGVQESIIAGTGRTSRASPPATMGSVPISEWPATPTSSPSRSSRSSTVIPSEPGSAIRSRAWNGSMRWRTSSTSRRST